MLTFGTQDNYEWLVTDNDCDLLEICPEIVLGKYIAITSIDSGFHRPTAEELAAGWQNRQKIAYSPKVTSPQSLPREGWDEWYIFENPTDLGRSHLGENIFEVPQQPQHVSVFVNYRFALHEHDAKTLADLFWQQIAWIRPESYIADSDFLNFVSANKTLFATVRRAVETLDQT